MNDGKISVIVPVYKVEPYLDRCVSSIVNQTYKNLEIILVDDGSPDRCGAMCDAWAARDSRIRVIHKENGGLSDARNAGMAVATGELLGFVDSDDWIAPDMYRQLYERMAEDASDIAACGVEMVWEDGRPPRRLTKEGDCVLDAGEAMRAVIEESWLKQPVWYKLYKTAPVRDIPFPVGKYHEDVFWTYQAVGAANQVSVVDQIGYYYLQRSGSIMGEGYSLKRLDAVEGKKQRLAFIHEHIPTLEASACVDLLFTCMYHGQQSLRYLHKEDGEACLRYLSECLHRHPYPKADFKKCTAKEKIWLTMAQISFCLTCKLRNMFRVGV